MRIAAHTLGCKLNYAETSDHLRRLAEAGHEVVDWTAEADLYIINTCTVTAVAEKKCRSAIRQAHRRNPDAQIVVMGCFAQTAADEVARIPGVTQVLGNESKRLLSYSTAGGHRTRTFFKIQDGCDYFCTYCAIPYARGRSRSATIEETLCAARRIADEGAKEVVLTGINTGTFGQHSGESFLDLLRRLDQIDGILRYRISSIEPNLLTDDIIDFVARSRAFLPHFHIPLQAGSDHVLQLMHRRYTTALYADKVRRIKAAMPDACIAADIMAGFNGENEEEFRKTLDFVASIPISYLHVFTYSDRPGTAALRLGEKIPVHLRHEHTHRLLQLSERKLGKFIQSQMGKTRPVLWESSIKSEVGGRRSEGGSRKAEVERNLQPPTSNLRPPTSDFQPPTSNLRLPTSDLQPPTSDFMEGWTDNYIRVRTPYDAAKVGTVEPVVLTEANIAKEAASD